MIQYVNPGYEKTTGYTLAEAVGKKPNIVKSGKHGEGILPHACGPPSAPARCSATSSSTGAKTASCTTRKKPSRRSRTSKGRITHFVSTGKDITERVRAEQALRAGACSNSPTPSASPISATGIETSPPEAWPGPHETFRIFGHEPQLAQRGRFAARCRAVHRGRSRRPRARPDDRAPGRSRTAAVQPRLPHRPAGRRDSYRARG